VEKYEQSARAIAEAVVSDPVAKQSLLECTPAGEDDAACFGQTIAPIARLAWRRTPLAAEVNGLVDAAVVAGAAHHSFDEGLEAAISAVLLSPYFLYIVELGEPALGESYRELNGTELATRKSMFILGQTPEPRRWSSAPRLASRCGPFTSSSCACARSTTSAKTARSTPSSTPSCARR
jgi:hypothetical protein